METEKTKVQNWNLDEDGYIFTYAKGREAVGVKVDLKSGTIREDETEKLHQISDNIIQKGLASLYIGPGELEAISPEDYLSDKYSHPADELMEHARQFQEALQPDKTGKTEG